MAEPTKIMACKPACKHNDQDQRYGKGNRVFNKIKTPDKTKSKYRCTICGNEQE